MSKGFVSLTSREALSFISGGSTKTGTHRMTEKCLHWKYCANCGLLNLKNEVTRQALKKPCSWTED